MSTKRTVARNILSNYAGTVVTMAAGFVTAPYLANKLGATGYGLWLLIGTFTGYLGLLDLGVRGSVGRFIAFHRARNDAKATNETLTTALILLCVPAMLSIVGSFLCVAFYFALFDVPVELADSVRLALLIAGINLAITFPLSVYEGVLWAHQRFDILNAVTVLLIAMRTALLFYFVGRGCGLVALASISLACTLICGSVKAFIAHRVDRSLRIRFGDFRRERFRSLVGYSFWYLILSTGIMITSQLSRVLIGSWLGVALVTPFNFASSLISYGVTLLMACTGVLTPLATSYHAGEEHEKQERLFVTGGKFCAFFAFGFVAGCLLLGRSFLGLWIPAHADAAYSVLAILVFGEGLAMSQLATSAVLLGAAQHQIMARLTLLEVAVTGVAMSIAVPQMGLRGAALGVAVSVFVCRGVLCPVYACKRLGYSYLHYVRNAFVPSFCHSVIPVLLLTFAVRWHAPESWLAFALFALGYGCALAVAGARLIGLWDHAGESARALLSRAVAAK